MPPTPLRRTQAERRATTQRALLDATIDVVVEHGYAGATTVRICERAGLSQGALFRHYPTKGDLFAAAVAALFPRLLDGFRELAPALPAGRAARREAAVDLLLAAYEQPELQAAVELYVAARTDADLATALGHVEPPHRASLYALAAELFPDTAGHPAFAGIVDVMVDAVQGAVLGRLLVLDPAGAAVAHTQLRDALVSVLQLTDALLPEPDLTGGVA